MRISCPLCGERALEEFTYRGDATKQRPTDNDMDKWVDYVFIRDNPKGPHKEHWYHFAGCGSWLEVERNTLTHEILNIQLTSEIGKSER